MRPIPHQIPRLLHPRLRHGRQLLVMPRVSQRLLDVVLRIRVEECRLGAEELAVGVYCTWEGVGEPGFSQYFTV